MDEHADSGEAGHRNQMASERLPPFQRGKSPNRLLWAALLARTFGLTVEVCQHCGGRMRIVAAITDPASIKHNLDGVGLPSEIPEIKPARPPPQLELEYTDYEYIDEL
ncbi:MAG: hypothetical protein GY847_34415 [Proteobacteria bacterium]|nr:hypothetical protein [Pseudomonadota bacterium]